MILNQTRGPLGLPPLKHLCQRVYVPMIILEDLTFHFDRRTGSNEPELEDDCVTPAGNKAHRTNDRPRMATQKQLVHKVRNKI